MSPIAPSSLPFELVNELITLTYDQPDRIDVLESSYIHTPDIGIGIAPDGTPRYVDIETPVWACRIDVETEQPTLTSLTVYGEPSTGPIPTRLYQHIVDYCLWRIQSRIFLPTHH